MLSFKVGLLVIEHRDGDLPPETIGKNVLMRRTAFNMTQAQVAFDAGLSSSTIGRIEKGWPCLETTLDKVAHALGTTPTKLKTATRPIAVSSPLIQAVTATLRRHGGPLRMDLIHEGLAAKYQFEGRLWRKSFRSQLEEMADKGLLVRSIRSVYSLPDAA